MNRDYSPDNHANEMISSVIDTLLKAYAEGEGAHIKSDEDLQKGIAYLLKVVLHFEVTVSAHPSRQFSPIPDAKPDEAEQYDVFVSHAWEDKKTFVNEFVTHLENAGIKVWYDQENIRWGDSLRQQMDNGLLRSRFAVIVLSPNYIRPDKFWTKAELDGLFQQESINGKTILPIWHNLTKKEVHAFSPIIASRMAMSTLTMSAAEIALEVVKILQNA